SIPLDPSLSPRENAERSFRRYRKLRDARSRIPRLLAAAESEAARLQDLKSFVPLAESESDLRALEGDISSRREVSPPKKKKQPGRRQPARYVMDGNVALVGRN